MTLSEAMIATSAELATDWPNVGPISETSGSPRIPNSSLSASVSCSVLPGHLVGDLHDVRAELLVADRLDLRVAEPDRRDHVADLIDGRGPLAARR